MVSKDICTVYIACSVVDAFNNPELASGSGSVSRLRFFPELKNLLLKKLDLILKHGNS
jgi:hypothetical protein